MYFSYVTLTTVGFGDLTASTSAGRMIAVSEALSGQLYLVSAVALLVGNIGRTIVRGGRTSDIEEELEGNAEAREKGVTGDRVDAINALLVEAKEAHGVFEATELGGVYDRAWADWYAAYAVMHGIGALVGRPVAVEELAQFLTSSNADFEAADPKPSVTWSAYTARRIAAEL